MTGTSHDLFDDGTMTFGEHLEELRVRLFLALAGLTAAFLLTLVYGEPLMDVVRQPIDAALARYADKLARKDDPVRQPKTWVEWFQVQMGFPLEDPQPGGAAPPPDQAPQLASDQIRVEIDAHAIAAQLHQAAPEAYPPPPVELQSRPLSIVLRSALFSSWRGTTEQMTHPITLNVQEGFMMYVKVAMIAAFVLASPWIFYQVWMFIAAGLYRHERKFVHLYGLMSLALFLTGVLFAYRYVFPYVLDYLLSFNLALELTPQIRLSEWVSFVLLLPLMFGVSFQLPLVMRFLAALQILRVEDFREKRRMAILVIAFLSMILTPADPMSMILMLVPLVVLYELGIVLCRYAPARNPFDAEPV